MAKPTVFIDGEAGTTGLEIRRRLEGRADLTLVSIAPERRKDAAARREALNEADLSILCLPDEAAKEAVAMVTSNTARILDASTAFRTAPGWAYGFPEMTADQTARIAESRRVANPGCYPQGYIAAVRPLAEAGLLPRDFPATYHAVSGYSGGGKAMIAEFEAEPFAASGGRAYGLKLKHKHAPEMLAHGGLDHPPVFEPLVGRYRQGMIGQVPLQLWSLPGNVTAEAIAEVLAARYAAPTHRRVRVMGVNAVDSGVLDAEALNGTDELELFVFSNPAARQATVVSRYDNLGKGASGAAVQNMEIMLGLAA